MDAPECLRCVGRVEELAAAVLTASAGRATFLECYAFAQAVARREASEAAWERALIDEFCQSPDTGN